MSARNQALKAITWPLRLTGFGLYFLWLLASSNWAVIRDSVTPGSAIDPGIVEFPLRCRTDFEVTLLANLISLTPGTLTLAVSVSGEHPVLYVHGMYAPDPDAFRAELEDMEIRMLRAVRIHGVEDSVAAGTSGGDSV
ncbi:MAG: Na+/H+ antiporter subunit E [Rhodococcus sp.]|nr:Na+/H+ antiporter subunit E [Rhodococcus sp. (in: high G+C Gram-positive bacteria)]